MAGASSFYGERRTEFRAAVVIPLSFACTILLAKMRSSLPRKPRSGVPLAGASYERFEWRSGWSTPGMTAKVVELM